FGAELDAQPAQVPEERKRTSRRRRSGSRRRSQAATGSREKPTEVPVDGTAAETVAEAPVEGTDAPQRTGSEDAGGPPELTCPRAEEVAPARRRSRTQTAEGEASD